MKVQEETGPKGSEPQVREHLCFVHGQELFDGFQFDDQSFGYDNVHPISAFKLYRLVDDRQRYLATELDSGMFEFKA